MLLRLRFDIFIFNNGRPEKTGTSKKIKLLLFRPVLDKAAHSQMQIRRKLILKSFHDLLLVCVCVCVCACRLHWRLRRVQTQSTCSLFSRFLKSSFCSVHHRLHICVGFFQFFPPPLQVDNSTICDQLVLLVDVLFEHPKTRLLSGHPRGRERNRRSF